MQEDKENQSYIKFKGGCFGCLLEILGILGIIGICYICGCSWARSCVLRCVREIHGAWAGATSSSSQSSATPERNY